MVLTTECGKVLLASIYLDYNLDVVPDWLEELVEYADAKKLPLLMAFDSNAHSTLYGPEDNERGVDFEEFITQNNLLVENRGNQSTFHAFRRGAPIDAFNDVTHSKNLIPLHDWKIHDQSYNGSDHHTITWFLPTVPPPPPLIRPWLKAKWNVFTEQIAEYNFHLPENLTPYKVDMLLDRWYAVVGDALDKACPKRHAKLNPIELDWFGDDVRYLQWQVRRM